MSLQGSLTSRDRTLQDVALELRSLARDLEISVIALSSTGRISQAGVNLRPTIHHVAPFLEESADLVILLHRPDAHDLLERPGEADLIVAKNRNGPTATIGVAFQGAYSRFLDMT